jgi:hypothetical protein
MSASVPGARPLIWNVDRAADRIARGIARGEREISFPWPLAALARIADALPPWLIDYLLTRTRGSDA